MSKSQLSRNIRLQAQECIEMQRLISINHITQPTAQELQDEKNRLADMVMEREKIQQERPYSNW